MLKDIRKLQSGETLGNLESWGTLEIYLGGLSEQAQGTPSPRCNAFIIKAEPFKAMLSKHTFKRYILKHVHILIYIPITSCNRQNEHTTYNFLNDIRGKFPIFTKYIFLLLYTILANILQTTVSNNFVRYFSTSLADYIFKNGRKNVFPK